MCCLTASFKYLKNDLFFSAEVCFEMENGVNNIWIQHDPKLFFSRFLSLPPSCLTQDILVRLEYCAIKMQNFVYMVLLVLFYLFCAGQIVSLKAFCSVPIGKAVLKGEVKKIQNRLENFILRGQVVGMCP